MREQHIDSFGSLNLKGEKMFMKKLGVAAALILCAFGASASNFRGADQVYLPAGGHLSGASGTFITDVYLANLSGDEIDVSVIFQSVGTGGGQGQEFKNVIQLRGFERKEFLDFFPGVLNVAQGFGQLIFNGCKRNTSCGSDTQDPDGFSENFRNLSVQARIYQIPNPGAGLPDPNSRQTGQLLAGIPWYHFVSSLQATSGLDKVFLTGITSNANFRANIGFTNASQFSRTTIKATLYQGTLTNADKKKEYFVELGPLGSELKGFNDMFGSEFSGNNFFVVVEQFNNVAEAGAPPGCIQGCPAFLTFGSVLDNRSGDASTIESQYMLPLTDPAIIAIYPNGTGSTNQRRSVRH